MRFKANCFFQKMTNCDIIHEKYNYNGNIIWVILIPTVFDFIGVTKYKNYQNAQSS